MYNDRSLEVFVKPPARWLVLTGHLKSMHFLGAHLDRSVETTSTGFPEGYGIQRCLTESAGRPPQERRSFARRKPEAARMNTQKGPYQGSLKRSYSWANHTDE